MKKRYYLFFFLILSTFIFNCSKLKENKTYKICVIIPSNGYEQILNGLKESIENSQYKGKIELIIKDFTIANNEFESGIKNLKEQDFDLFYTVTTPATVSVYSIIKNKPIIFTAVEDPITAGLAESFKKPKKGITGITDLGKVLITKRLEYLKLAFPHVKKIFTFYNRENGFSQLVIKDLENISEKLNVKIERIDFASVDELRRRLKEVKISGIEGGVIVPDSIVMSGIDDIIKFSENTKLPISVCDESFVNKGATMSYGVDLKEMGKMSFIIIDHILKGGNPEDLHIFVPEKIRLVINNRWAKDKKYNIPNELIYLADKVIE
ncbi:MAG: ABC transporter substrate-binding protein [Proteobacteria bacterium]|nr:ABC transporter substrate-binding protein [Pseudomonadota bacterium]